MQSKPIPVRVKSKTPEATDIVSFELVPIGADSLPSYKPGAHIDVDIGNGQVRQYSLCTPHADNSYVICVKLDAQSRGGSSYMHVGVKEADTLLISPPRNHFPLASDGSHFILVAGGIGLTPLLAMAIDLASAGKSFELHYFTQSADHVALRRYMDVNTVAPHVTHHHGVTPTELPGVLDSIVGKPETGKYLYLCGPRPFMELVRQSAVGWPADNIKFEYFGAMAGQATEKKKNASFEVCSALSGSCFEVTPTQSIVEVLRANGIHVETSCEEGHCGTCLTEVLEGEPDHRDSYLTPEERAAGGRMLPCVSRSCSARLVLNI